MGVPNASSLKMRLVPLSHWMMTSPPMGVRGIPVAVSQCAIRGEVVGTPVSLNIAKPEIGIPVTDMKRGSSLSAIPREVAFPPRASDIPPEVIRAPGPIAERNSSVARFGV